MRTAAVRVGAPATHGTNVLRHALAPMLRRGGAAAVHDAVAASVGALLQAASSSTARPWMLGVQAVNRHLDSVVSAVEHPVDATGANATALVADSTLAEVGLRESGWCVMLPSSFTASAGEEALAVARYTTHVRCALARSHRPLSLAGEVVRALIVRGKDSRTVSAAKSEVPEMALWRSLLVGPDEGAPVRILAGPTAAFISADSWAVLFPATTKPSVSSVSEQTSSTTSHACETCWRSHAGVCFDENRCGACRGTGPPGRNVLRHALAPMLRRAPCNWGLGRDHHRK